MQTPAALRTICAILIQVNPSRDSDPKRRRKFVRVRHPECETIRHDSTGFDEPDQTVGESLLVDFQSRDAPVGVVGSGEPELRDIFKICVLRLKVLGIEKHPFRPDHALMLLHGYLPCASGGPL